MFPIISISKNEFNRLEECSICCSSFNEGMPEEFQEDLPRLINSQNALIAHNDENGKKHPLHLDCFNELRNHTFSATCPNCRVPMENNLVTLHIDTNTSNGAINNSHNESNTNRIGASTPNSPINPTNPSMNDRLDRLIDRLRDLRRRVINRTDDIDDHREILNYFLDLRRDLRNQEDVAIRFYRNSRNTAV